MLCNFRLASADAPARCPAVPALCNCAWKVNSRAMISARVPQTLGAVTRQSSLLLSQNSACPPKTTAPSPSSAPLPSPQHARCNTAPQRHLPWLPNTRLKTLASSWSPLSSTPKLETRYVHTHRFSSCCDAPASACCVAMQQACTSIAHYRTAFPLSLSFLVSLWSPHLRDSGMASPPKHRPALLP